MKITMNKAGFISLLLICMACFATCEFTKQVQATEQIPTPDTLFLNQWRREKAERLKLAASYEAKLMKLQNENDSLKNVVAEKKQNLAGYRLKEKILQERLREQLIARDTASYRVVTRDSIPSIIDSLVFASQQNDTACDQVVNELENQLANRDSSIILHRQATDNLREIQKQQELSNQYLTEQLNTAFKSQRRKSRQNKILAGTVLILSGITTSILLTNSLR